ncbi:MAG: hypothetical protein LBJ21_08180 [Acidobacteriota bacterium]|nr:hypothetical protein [Acidobacteriota bacterium]
MPQPAQLPALHEEQPEDVIERVLPSLPLETPLKQEKSLSTSGESQPGQ